MADINVERRGPTIWPWIIGLLVLALIVWALMEMYDVNSDPAVTAPPQDTTSFDPSVTPRSPVGTATQGASPGATPAAGTGAVGGSTTISPGTATGPDSVSR